MLRLPRPMRLMRHAYEADKVNVANEAIEANQAD